MKNYAEKFIGKMVTVKVDRPLGSKHPKFGFVYGLNYGFIPGTMAPDGEEIDAYILGVVEPVSEFTGKCVAIVHRINDDDDKLVIVSDNCPDLKDEEIKKAIFFQEQWFESRIMR